MKTRRDGLPTFLSSSYLFFHLFIFLISLVKKHFFDVH
jgi:hypothetical protein